MEKSADVRMDVAGESDGEEKDPPPRSPNSEAAIKVSDKNISVDPNHDTEIAASSAMADNDEKQDQDEPEINVFLDRLEAELILGNEYILETSIGKEEYSKVQEDPYERPLVMRGEETRNEDNRGEDDPFPERSDFEYNNEFLQVLLSFIADIEPPQNYLSAANSNSGYLRGP